MAYQSNCPACGDTIEFSIGTSVVAVCGSCSNLVGRGDGALESYGKVAELAETDSPLQIGLAGETRGIPFVVTGRTQYRHAAGGVWDEWYIALKGGKQWGWLAEARGRYYLTFHKKIPSKAEIPPVAELKPQQRIMIPGQGVMTVVEVATGEVIAAEGELPTAVTPGEQFLYADLEGPAGKFATLDASTNPPSLYIGGEFPLERLGISPEAASRERELKQAAAADVQCPNCGGSLELQAPDETERVGCPYCGSLLDVNEGSLQFLSTLKNKVEPVIPLGSKGTIEGKEYTVIGFMQRKETSDGTDYFWTEYLLYAPRQPFHWLVCNQYHWTFARAISGGNVSTTYRTATFNKRNFKLFHRGMPKVTYVVGEFYWKVEVGETVMGIDYVDPPYMLSVEESIPVAVDASEAAANVPMIRDQSPTSIPTLAEVNYSVGKYMPVEEVESAFGITGLSSPWSVAPNQPYPHKSIYMLWGVIAAIALFVGLFFWSIAPRRTIYSQQFTLEKTTSSQQVQFSAEPFEVSGTKNLEITALNDQTNRWSYATVAFVEDGSDKNVMETTLGVETNRSGPSRGRTKYYSSIPGGKYNLRTTFRWQDMPNHSQKVTIRIRQGVPRLRSTFYLLLLISILPIFVAIRHGIFESQRWAESGVN